LTTVYAFLLYMIQTPPNCASDLQTRTRYNCVITNVGYDFWRARSRQVNVNRVNCVRILCSAAGRIPARNAVDVQALSQFLLNKMVNGFRYYIALESVSIGSALSTALTIYPRQIRVHQRWQSKLQLPTARKNEWRPATLDSYPRRLPVNTVIHTTLVTFRLLVRRATSSATDPSLRKSQSPGWDLGPATTGRQASNLLSTQAKRLSVLNHVTTFWDSWKYCSLSNCHAAA